MSVYRPGDEREALDASETVEAREPREPHETQHEREESPEEIRVEIEMTRAEMSGTIDEIQARLNPEVVKAQVQEMVQERTEEVKEHVQEAITEHVEQVKSQVRGATIGRVESMVHNVSEGLRGYSGGNEDREGYRGDFRGGEYRGDFRSWDYRGGNYRGGTGSFLDTVRANPVPTALVGIGLGWLLSQRRNSGQAMPRGNMRRDAWDDRDYRTTTYGDGRYRTGGYGDDNDTSLGDRVGDTMSDARDRVGQVADTVGDRVGDLRDQAGDRVSSFTDQAGDRLGDLRDQAGDRVGAFTDQAQQTAGQAKSTFQQQLEDNPLAVGAVAIALGLAAGMTLPSTPVEDRTFGEARDNLMGQVQQKAQDTLQKVQQVAQDVQQSASQTAKESAQRQGLTQTTQQ